MDRFFNSDNIVMRALSKIFDMCWLSLIYMVFCLPIVTVGAATTAMYYTSAKVLRRNRSYVWSGFWHSFKDNFRQSTVIWIITLIVYIILYLNMTIMFQDKKNEWGGYLVGAYFALMLILLLISMYVYPIMSRLQLKITHILRVSLYSAFRYFYFTFAVLAILAASATLLYFSVMMNIIITVILIPGLTGFCVTFPMECVLKKYTKNQEVQYTEDGEPIVPWYNE